MAGILKSLPVAATIAIGSAVATAVQIRLADSPLRVPESAEGLPTWLVTAPNPWMVLTALLALVAGSAAIARRRRRSLNRAPASSEPALTDPPRLFPWSLTSAEREEAQRLGLFGGPAPELPDLTDPQNRMLPNLATAAARQQFTRRIALAERLSAAPGMADLQREVWDGHMKLGELAMMERSLLDAMFSFEAALDAVEKWATTEPAFGGWQIPMLETHLKLGDTAQAIGVHSSARAHYEHGLRVAEKMARSAEPGSQHNLVVFHNKLGDAALVTGDPAAARRHFEAGLGIAQQRAAEDPAAAEGRRDLAIVTAYFGQLAHVEGDRVTAVRRIEEAEAMIRALVRELPDHARFARDVTWIGDCLRVVRGY